MGLESKTRSASAWGSLSDYIPSIRIPPQPLISPWAVHCLAQNPGWLWPILGAFQSRGVLLFWNTVPKIVFGFAFTLCPTGRGMTGAQLRRLLRPLVGPVSILMPIPTAASPSSDSSSQTGSATDSVHQRCEESRGDRPVLQRLSLAHPAVRNASTAADLADALECTHAINVGAMYALCLYLIF
jgi:hypothetical protein